jgi:hypothetical protein
LSVWRQIIKPSDTMITEPCGPCLSHRHDHQTECLLEFWTWPQTRACRRIGHSGGVKPWRASSTCALPALLPSWLRPSLGVATSRRLSISLSTWSAKGELKPIIFQKLPISVIWQCR